MGLESASTLFDAFRAAFAPCVGLERMEIERNLSLYVFAPCVGLERNDYHIKEVNKEFAPCVGLES